MAELAALTGNLRVMFKLIAVSLILAFAISLVSTSRGDAFDPLAKTIRAPATSR